MSRGINKVILVGNVGEAPQIRSLPSGKMVANFSVATSESWIDKNTGEKQEKTEWHRVIIFDRLAEIVQQYVGKGSKLYVEGKLQTRKWTDNQGIERYSTEIVCNELQMLNRIEKGQSAGVDPLGGWDDNQKPAAKPAQAFAFDDDLPF